MQKIYNSYLDVIKFIFALIILEFHLNSGLFPGGRLAVEGFFMISGYLMMNSINRDKNSNKCLGLSTIEFLVKKYINLLPVLIPSALLGYIVYSIRDGRTLIDFFKRMPLLLFDIIPLREAGFNGIYVLGISWYLSAMFLSLAMLYPLCRKFQQSFTLTICPLIAILIYGFLSHSYGHLAIASMYIDGIAVNAGLLRGLAGSSLGILLYEICQKVPAKGVTQLGRTIFTLIELISSLYLFYSMHFLAKSSYDYVCVFVIWLLLLIGISGISATSLLLAPKWSRYCRTWSTLIVLNHCYWRDFLPKLLGDQYVTTNQIIIYFALVICSCIIVYLLSKIVRLLMNKITALSLFTS